MIELGSLQLFFAVNITLFAQWEKLFNIRSVCRVFFSLKLLLHMHTHPFYEVLGQALN